MNNKGQTLVLFVVLIPFILMLFAFVFDSAYISRKDTELEGIATSSLKALIENNKTSSDVVKVIKENDENIEVISIDNNSIHLMNKIDPIFGKIIGYDKYNLEVNLQGKIINGKLIIEEKGKWYEKYKG